MFAEMRVPGFLDSLGIRYLNIILASNSLDPALHNH